MGTHRFSQTSRTNTATLRFECAQTDRRMLGGQNLIETPCYVGPIGEVHYTRWPRWPLSPNIDLSRL